MKKNKFKFLIFFLVVCLISIALPQNIPDSLRIVSTKQKDSVLVDTYFSLFRYYFKKDHQPDSMAKYAQLAYLTAEKFNLSPRLIKSKRAIALSFIEAQKIDLAKKCLSEGLLLAKKYSNVDEIIEMNNLLGYLYGKENELDKSAFYYLNSAKEYEKMEDYANLAFTYKNIVVIFTLQDQFQKNTTVHKTKR